MQSMPRVQYSNPAYPVLGKAADEAQKFAESFASLVSVSLDEMFSEGLTGVERFCKSLEKEVASNRKTGSLSEEGYEVDDRIVERWAVRQVLGNSYSQNLIQRRISSIGQLAHDVLLTAACAPVFVPPGLLSQSVFQALQKRTAPLIGREPEKYRRGSLKAFSLFTLNCSLFRRRVLNTRRGMDAPLGPRTIGIGRFLRDLRPSVICLQGVYHARYAKKHIIARLLKKNFGSVLAVKPGLLTASAYPVRDVEYHLLKDRSDAFELGVLLTTHKVAGSRHVVVANTRLFGGHEELAGEDVPNEEIRVRQLKQVRMLIRNYSHRSRYPVYDRLIAGDLGMSPVARCSRFPLTRSEANGEYESLKESLLDRFKGLSYVDMTSGIGEGTQLEPRAVTFAAYIYLVADKAFSIMKKQWAAFCSREGPAVHWKLSFMIPNKNAIYVYLNAALGSVKLADQIADQYGWKRIDKKFVRIALDKASDYVNQHLFRYPERTDYICLAARKSNIFSEAPKALKTFVITSEEGIICDKFGVCVEFDKKESL